MERHHFDRAVMIINTQVSTGGRQRGRWGFSTPRNVLGECMLVVSGPLELGGWGANYVSHSNSNGFKLGLNDILFGG